jgi:hypothetical protein
VHDRPRRDSPEYAFALEDEPQARDCLGVRHEQLAVEPGDVEDRRHVAVLERAQAHDRVARKRLCRRDDDVRERLAKPLAGSHERAARAESRHEDVDAVERRSDLRTGPLVVSARIRLVRVLERHEQRRVPLGELDRKADGAIRSLLARRVDDLRAVKAKEAPPLGSHVRGHDTGERVAPEPRGERERDPRVAARRLE